MAESETRIRIVDTDGVKETIALGPWLPTLVVVARIMLPPDGALALANLINESAARDKATAGHIFPDDKGGHA